MDRTRQKGTGKPVLNSETASIGPKNGETMADYELLKCEDSEGVLVVGMDDGKANALGFKMIEELSMAFDRAKGEGLAVVLTGRTGMFSAGLDLRVMKSGVEGIKSMVSALMGLCAKIYTHPRPVVMVCTGHAFAGGAVLLLTGDTRIGAAGDIKIGLNETAIGLAMPSAVSVLAGERLSKRYFSRSVLEAEIFDPEGARRAGFLDRVVTAESAMEEAVAHARKLAAYPAKAYAATKASTRVSTVQRALKALESDLALITEAL